MKKIGIGYEKYKEFIDRDMYYVDKTLLIRDIINKGGETTLITRPRRFGKTLALSMLRTFFEIDYDLDGNIVDNRRYFEGKKIMEAGGEVISMMGQYPVIKLSLKSAKQPDFYRAFMILRDDIIGEFDRHLYLKGSDKLGQNDIDTFNELLNGRMNWNKKAEGFKDKAEKEAAFREEVGRYATALKTLSELLKPWKECDNPFG